MQTTFDKPGDGKPLALDDVYSPAELSDHDVVGFNHFLERPTDLPADSEAYKVQLAEQILSNAIQRDEIGHHATLRREIQDWASQFRGDDENRDLFEGAFNLTPPEIARFTIGIKAGKQKRKAEAVIQWANNYDEGLVDGARDALVEEAREKWSEKVDEATQILEGAHFKRDPPESVGAWTRMNPSNDTVELAYKKATGSENRTKIVAVYEDDRGTVAYEFTQENWEDANGDPTQAQMNRPIGPTAEGILVYKKVVDYLDPDH
jgi:hypothetical protein